MSPLGSRAISERASPEEVPRKELERTAPVRPSKRARKPEPGARRADWRELEMGKRELAV